MENSAETLACCFHCNSNYPASQKRVPWHIAVKLYQHSVAVAVALMHIGPWNEVFLILLHPHLHWLVASSLTSCVGRLYISVLPSTRNHQTMISCVRCKQEAVHAGADGKVCACDRCKHHWCDPCAHELWGEGRGMLSCQLCNSELCVGHRRRLFRLAANVIFRHATFVQRKGRAKACCNAFIAARNCVCIVS